MTERVSVNMSNGMGMGWFSRLRSDVAEIIREMVDYRELLYSMTWRDLLLRYKDTVMGFGWAVFMPLLNMMIFSVIFTRVAPIDVGMPYPLYAYSGLLAWNFLASALRFSVISLTGNVTLVTKVYFPREVFPFSALLVTLVDFAVGSLVLVGLMLYYGAAITPAILFLPVILLVLVMFTAGMALILAMGNLFYRDIKYLFEIVISLWMFATSVVYPVSRVGGKLGGILELNPMTPIIEAYRSVLLRGQLPNMESFAWAAGAAFTLLAVGWISFHRAEYQFAENI